MGRRVSGPLRAEAPFCSGAVASSRVHSVEEKLPCEDQASLFQPQRSAAGKPQRWELTWKKLEAGGFGVRSKVGEREAGSQVATWESSGGF